jgi:two-component system cell cycle sensor histidine kinase/response regulator CckA
VASELPAPNTVLVVDDTEKIRALIVRALTGAGYRTIEATNGEEALELFAKHRDEIVAATLDLDMPQLGGRDTLIVLSERAPFLPILVVTGWPLEGLQGRIPGTPGVGYLAKPFQPARLVSGLKEMIDEVKPRHLR